MKRNPYDQQAFFEKYEQMDRSKYGLSGAGEWSTLQQLLPDFQHNRVLDLGCGYGWHCVYALEQGAKQVVGIDVSEKMIGVAKEKTAGMDNVSYVQTAIEDVRFDDESFDAVMSSLAFHYVESFDRVAKNVHRMLATGGQFVFSVEHPVFTAEGSQQWHTDDKGNIQHFPVDRYFYEGERDTTFLGETVTKYHRTLTTYVDALLTNGFRLDRLVEPMPPASLEMEDEMRRPMMLIVRATKQ
ncbi:bifunctional 2-polyprenyl-6-hydroxyphenol methylase/3-demethylubiquinol 3-O-methyltransferase UbiG [Geomicrobium sp. JCM 19039]|uniref:class I SAM-dependent methyltransferase n=1 Tax=Geomicrobium sp. JCM 19039 TaxID=1460636 RepID=UPI00045F31DB|nr:class I SAM-dependent methyltransferase [Geomicrobium sp. JCM 19039]GAK14121.1 methyltransferase, UbiE/COQ5 family [Geomicrobium sp. JCM 19039]